MSRALDRYETTAYRLDLYRVVPRAVLVWYGIGVWHVSAWFMALPDPSNAQSAFVSVVAGIAPLLFSFYAAHGVDWEKRIATRALG